MARVTRQLNDDSETNVYVVRGFNYEARHTAAHPFPAVIPLQTTFADAANLMTKMIVLLHDESIHNTRRIVMRAMRDTDRTLIIDAFAPRRDGSIPPQATMRVILNRLDVFAPELLLLYSDHIPPSVIPHIAQEIHEIADQRGRF
ncbi:hypothetical protein NLN96_18905 [Citrobacter portucalensis]|uniref:hypothetical protein n=1 Tax=Citrobacter portucalensis TaxID=1639133 RepID=UPI00226B7828|nr:hypothetical protein [Citrobacter portucalensis]MCX9019067.1 hypothetical protein [Citrobacter portucalensis]